jgi:hypothetical protein
MKPAAYQERRQQLLAKMDKLREVRDDLKSHDPVFFNDLPVDVRQKMDLLERESIRLRNPDLTISFVGGFSAGKSSLVNAFLGRYLLPESTKVTTAVPTFVRTTTEQESAELHYLNEAEIVELDKMYREEISLKFKVPELANEPYSTFLEKIKPLTTEGRGRRLLEQFQIFQEQRRMRQVDPRGLVVTTSISEAQDKIRNETEAMFLDRVVLRIRNTQLPEDVVLVDLPGISVPNPRHKRITFRFVTEDAHALVFVLNSTALFNADETEIVELVRAGESRIAEKTFWVLNRWDSLMDNALVQNQTIADFENKMREFGFPSGYQSFRTNALHGLLAQLSNDRESQQDTALAGHFKSYDDALASRYGGNHQTALRESQLPMLQVQVLSFLNERLRKTTLSSAYENARANLCDPLVHHLRRAKEADDALLNGDLKRQEKETSRKRVDDRCKERESELDGVFQELLNEIAGKRGDLFREQTKEIVEKLRSKIASGPETDAYQICIEIITGGNLRKYPYHFEIEMRIIDKLNTMLKQEFRQIVRGQMEEVFGDLVKRVHNALKKIGTDVSFNTQVMNPFGEVLQEERGSFSQRADGLVMDKAANLDTLLLYKPKTLMFWGGNEILEGLESAARLGFENIQNSGENIKPEHMVEKTKIIRATLTDHYIATVRNYHETIITGIFPLVIDNMLQIKGRLLKIMQSKYRPALEVIMSQKVEGDFSSRKKGVEDRSRRFRDTVEQIEQLGKEMALAVAEVQE